MTNEEIVRAYAAAEIAFDSDRLTALRHPQWTAWWPQSGELIRGVANERAIMQNYPGGAPQVIATDRLVGDADRWGMSPSGGVFRVAGEGENWWGEWRMRYPDGRVYLTVILIELRDGKVYRETLYWAEPFEAPEWRAQYTERVTGA
jgi:hypothetical protein